MVMHAFAQNIAARRPSVTGGGGGGPTVNFVTSMKVRADTFYSTTTPAIAAALMPNDGNTVELVLNNGATTVDPTKFYMDIDEWSWTNGLPTAKVRRRIWGRWQIAGPYNEASLKKPGGSTIHIVMSSNIYNAGQVDTQGRTQNSDVAGAGFLADFTTGSTAGALPGVIVIGREDGESWPIPNFRHVSHPHQVNSGTLEYELGVVCRFARNGKPVDSVEAWAYSGGQDGSGGTEGVRGLCTTPVISRFTPAGNPTAKYGQDALRATVYRMDVAIGALSDTADPNNPVDGVCFRVMPHIGMDYLSTDIGDAWSAVGITPNLPKCLPMIINQSGKYDPRYIWWNASLTAGGAPAIQTGTTDPGSNASYGFLKAAVDAGIAHNVARGHPAGSMTGLIIMCRDIAGSVMGANDNGAGAAGAYQVGGTSIWNSTTNYRGMLTIRRAATIGSALYAGSRSQECRVRGVNSAGANLGGKTIAPKITWIDLEFDSTGTGDTAAVNQIITAVGGSSGTTQQPYVTQAIQVFFNCRKQDNSLTAAWTSNASVITANMGHLYEYLFEAPTAITGQGHDFMNGHVVSAGSFYQIQNLTLVAFQNACIAPAGLFGVWVLGGGMQGQGTTNPTTPVLKGTVAISVRMDAERSGTTGIGAVNVWGDTTRGNGTNPLGAGLCGVLFVRKAFAVQNPYSGPFIYISADQTRSKVNNYVNQHVMSMCAGNPGAARRNGPYNESGAGFIYQDFVDQHCAWHSIIMKNGFFGDITTPSTHNDGAHTPTPSPFPYAQGAVTHDNNATPALRIYKFALYDVPNGTLFSDAAYWETVPVAYNAQYQGQSRRNGNMKPRCGVDWRNNESGPFVGGTGGETPDSWFANCRMTGAVREINTGDPSDWVVNDQSGTSASAITDCGDYHAKPGGQLVNRVGAGEAVTAYDPYGTPRPNDGTGAIGFAEAA